MIGVGSLPEDLASYIQEDFTARCYSGNWNRDVQPDPRSKQKLDRITIELSVWGKTRNLSESLV